jgi:integrase
MGKAFYFLRPSKSNLHSLWVGLRHTEGQFLLSTGIKISPKHWNSKKSEVKNVSLPDLDMKSNILQRKAKDEDITSFTNNTLNEITNFINARSHLDKESIKAEFSSFLFRQSEAEGFVSDLHRFCIDFLNKSKNATKESLIAEIDTFLHPPQKQHNLFEYIENFIHGAESGSRLNDGKIIARRTIQRYRTTQTLLLEFQTVTGYEIAFNSIDKEFIDAFNSFMATHKKYSPATMGKHVQTFKSFLTEATEGGVNTNLKFKGKAFAVMSTVKDAIHLSESELKSMYELDFSKNERLDKVRDLFIVGAWTGLRISDFMDIKPENIKQVKDGYELEIIQDKTKGKVFIPLNDTVLAILKKYANQLPQISEQKFNNYIKEVAALVPKLHEIHERSITKGGETYIESNPKYELVSGHTARRSFATNAYERGVPTLSIMAITGHQTEKSFMAYIKTSKKKHSEIFRKHSK